MAIIGHLSFAASMLSLLNPHIHLKLVDVTGYSYNCLQESEKQNVFRW